MTITNSSLPGDSGYERERKAMYAMKMHDQIELWNGLDILRVPGGWIYITSSENGTGGYDMSSCFVPYDNQFQI